jgi:hypothetical protein
VRHGHKNGHSTLGLGLVENGFQVFNPYGQGVTKEYTGDDVGHVVLFAPTQ